MASKLLEQSVAEENDGTWTFTCPVNDGSCGPQGEDVSFRSDGWPSKKTALARGQEHFDDHKGIAPMSTLEEFRIKHNLQVDPSGRVTAKDL